MNEDLIIINSEIVEQELSGTMRRFIRIYFFDKLNDKVIAKLRLIENE